MLKSDKEIVRELSAADGQKAPLLRLFVRVCVIGRFFTQQLLNVANSTYGAFITFK